MAWEPPEPPGFGTTTSSRINHHAKPGVHEDRDVKKELLMPSFSHCDLKTTLVLNYLHRLETVGFDTYRIQITPFEVIIAAADSRTVRLKTS